MARRAYASFEEELLGELNKRCQEAAETGNTEEDVLALQIRGIWSIHVFRTDTIRRNRGELEVIRGYLRKRPYKYKQLLVGKGRGGQWLPFLRENGIPRSTADRYANSRRSRQIPQ